MKASNNTIWKRIHNTINKFEYGVNVAVTSLKKRIATIDIIKNLKLISGRYAFEGAHFLVRDAYNKHH